MDHERDILEQQLWELLYDLLPEEEAHSLRGRIGSDPEVGALYARVIRQKGEIAEAVKAPCDDFLVSIPAPAAGLSLNGKPSPQMAVGLPRPKNRRQFGGFDARRLASLIVTLGAAVLLGWIGYAWLAPGSLLSPGRLADAQARLLAEHRRVVIAGPSRVVEGAPQSFSVTVGDVAGKPISSSIAYAFYGDRGDTPIALGRAETGTDGRAMVEPPRSWGASWGRLEVRAPEDSEPVVARFAVTPPQYTARVTLDKTVYAPGDTVRFCGRALTPFGAAPAEPVEVQLALHDAEGNPIPGAVHEERVEQGVIDGAFTLPSAVLEGDYTLAMASPGSRVESEQEELAVRFAPPPVLASRGVETLQRSFQVRMKSDAPLAAAPAPPADQRLSQVQNFFFETEDVNESLAFAQGAGGGLGAAARDDAAASTAGVLAQLDKKYTQAESAPVADLAAGSFGMAAPNANVWMSLEDGEIEEGASLRVQVGSQQPGMPLAVGAACGGALVAQRAIALSAVEPETPLVAEIELPLPEGAAGPLEVGLYDYSQSPPALVTSQALYCKPRRQLRIEARPLSSEPAAGAEQLEIVTTDENGARVQSQLCITGQVQPGDESHSPLRLADRARRTADNAGAVAVEALGELSKRESANGASDGIALAAPEGVTRGFGGFGVEASNAWSYGRPLADQLAALQLPPTNGARAASPRPIDPPNVVDNYGALQTRLDAEFANLHERRNREGARIARVSAIGGAILVGLFLGAAFLKVGLPTSIWTVTLASALVALGIGVSRPQAAPPAKTMPALVAFPAASPAPGMIESRGGDLVAEVDALAALAEAPLEASTSVGTSPTTNAESKSDQLDVWLPRLSTDEAGKATIPLPRPAQPTTVRLRLEGHGKDRTGFAELEIQLLPRE
jgi:hypothetical protein